MKQLNFTETNDAPYKFLGAMLAPKGGVSTQESHGFRRGSMSTWRIEPINLSEFS